MSTIQPQLHLSLGADMVIAWTPSTYDLHFPRQAESPKFQECKESAQRNCKDMEVLSNSKAGADVKSARTIKKNSPRRGK